MFVTLFNRMMGSRMKVDLDPDEKLRDIVDVASDAWGDVMGVALRDGYSILNQDSTIGCSIRDGDVVELLPDPFGGSRWNDIRHTCRGSAKVEPLVRKDGNLCGRPVRSGGYGLVARCGRRAGRSRRAFRAH